MRRTLEGPALKINLADLNKKIYQPRPMKPELLGFAKSPVLVSEGCQWLAVIDSPVTNNASSLKDLHDCIEQLTSLDNRNIVDDARIKRAFVSTRTVVISIKEYTMFHDYSVIKSFTRRERR